MRLTLPIFVLVFVVSCTTTQYATLNLAYNPSMETTHPQQEEVRIALLKPVYTTAVQRAIQQLSLSPFGSLMEQAMPPDYRLKSKYNKEYVLRLQNAMLADLERIIADKGLKVYKSYTSLDEIPYSDKKNIDLVMLPEFDIAPIITNKRSVIPVVGVKRDEGVIQLAGRVKLTFLEPMSKEKIVIKNIDVTSLGINNSVTYKSSKDADNQLITLLNETYPALMEKIDTLIDAQEIANSLKDIRHLKEKYR
ncbi:MAG: hypothetical protein D6710_09365 [Nitrospirae bacterium]|nr:MAG: hypothetical protein D6710_09365 [Nitrospirota bacterium]